VPKRNLIIGLVLALAILLAGCGSSSTAPAPAGLTISGPGLSVGTPPWPAEYQRLAQRLREMGLPPGGSETFHHHAMLHIYVNGLLAPLAANTGLEPAKHLESSLHTHDRTGIIHMEAPSPYPYTLGDFFKVWGVKLGPAQVGGLTGLGGDHLHFYVDGRPLSNPGAYAFKNNDSVVIGYGAEGSFPHTPSTYLLKEVEGKGGAALTCSSSTNGKKKTSCLSTTPPATPAPGTSTGSAR
jgi:hypothetical protein